ncbi:MAG TPA: CBS domain-containing protein [Polyangia bacterium]|nr:CBS domain-containing protein [Polyangia bacterium]
MKITDLMTADVATCAPTDSLNRAAQLMWERRCGCIPVVDAAAKVVGVVTDRDVCMSAYTQGRRLDDVAVSTAMSRPARTCPPTTTVEDAEDLMMAYGVRRLVVVDAEERALGVLSLDDVAKSGAAWDGKGEIDLERVALTLGEVSRVHATDEMVPEEIDTTVAEVVRNSLAALKTLRDEMRVDLNLAAKDMRDRWRRLETRLRAAETRARDSRRRGASQLAGLVESAAQLRRQVQGQTTGKRARPS